MKNEKPFGQSISEGWDRLIEHLNRLHLTEEQIAMLSSCVHPSKWPEDWRER